MGYRNSLSTTAISPRAFFDRFGASPEQRLAYQPLFLTINSTCDGSDAPSFGLFERKGQLFTVSGSECSQWGFEGQFEPELTSLRELQFSLDHDLGMVDGRDFFHSGLRAVSDRIAASGRFQSVGELSSSYVEYLSANEVGKIQNLPSMSPAFSDREVFVEPGLSFYRFDLALGQASAPVFVSPSGTVSIGASEGAPRDMFGPEMSKFVSDLLGSIELGIDIFASDSSSAPARKSPRP